MWMQHLDFMFPFSFLVVVVIEDIGIPFLKFHQIIYMTQFPNI